MKKLFPYYMYLRYLGRIMSGTTARYAPGVMSFLLIIFKGKVRSGKRGSHWHVSFLYDLLFASQSQISAITRITCYTSMNHNKSNLDYSGDHVRIGALQQPLLLRIYNLTNLIQK